MISFNIPVSSSDDEAPEELTMFPGDTFTVLAARDFAHKALWSTGSACTFLVANHKAIYTADFGDAELGVLRVNSMHIGPHHVTFLQDRKTRDLKVNVAVLFRRAKSTEFTVLTVPGKVPGVEIPVIVRHRHSDHYRECRRKKEPPSDQDIKDCYAYLSSLLFEPWRSTGKPIKFTSLHL
ncbi:hypothetical protein HDE_08536 [Halotydeus destructor]|nr:hypothetical protein HDE_08536 [Halotydeus destructor]